jgi:hypothetical protein
MPEGITSNVRLFADDTIEYLTISSDQDARTLQSDLDKLEKWETCWLMAFHPEKCNVLTITKKRNPIKFKRPSRNCNTHTEGLILSKNYQGLECSKGRQCWGTES